jgi:hypothetical protein
MKKEFFFILDHMNIWASSSDKIWTSLFPMGRVCIRCMQYTHEKNIFSATHKHSVLGKEGAKD